MGVARNLFIYMVYIGPFGSKHESESLFRNLVADIVEGQTLGGIVLLGGSLMRVLQCYQIPLTLATFVNCYMHLNSWTLSN
jgi:hypothetical protein